MTTGFYTTPTAFNGQQNGLFRPANSNTSFGLTQGQSPFGTFGFGQSFAELGNNSGQSAFNGGFTPFLTQSQFAGGGTFQNGMGAPQVGFGGFDDVGGDSGGMGPGSNSAGDLGDIGGPSAASQDFSSPGMGMQNPDMTTGQALGNALGVMGPLGMAASMGLAIANPNNPSLSMTGRTGMNPFGSAQDVSFDQSFSDESGVSDIGEVGGFSVGQEDVGFGDAGFGGMEAGLGVSADINSADEGDGGDGEGGCVIATHALANGAFTRRDRREAVVWCSRNLHGSWWGEAFRRGYRHAGKRAIARGEAAKHYDEFRRFVAFVTGKRRDLGGAWIVARRGVQFFLSGMIHRAD